MNHTALTILLVGFLALSAGALVVGAQVDDGAHGSQHAQEASLEEHDGGDGQITYFRMSGRGNISNQYEIVENHPGPPFVWDSESLSFGVSVTSESTDNTQMVCGTIYDDEDTEVESLGCNSWNHTTPYRLSNFELDEWPNDANGTHYIVFEFIEQRPAEGNESDAEGEDGPSTEDVVLDSYEHEVYVISKEGDLAGNGISNAREVEVGTDFTQKDTSGNGLSDWEEMYRYGTDPLEKDTTGDGIDDGTIASMGLNPAIPYIVHLVVTGTLLGMAAIAVTGLKFRRYLRNLDRTATTSPAASTSTTDDGTDDDAAYGDRGIPSKEEEVFHIIREHGGRMKQADLVDETEWSKATVSRLLSTLEEEGRVEKVRVGRGNVVMLTDEQTNDEAKA